MLVLDGFYADYVFGRLVTNHNILLYFLYVQLDLNIYFYIHYIFIYLHFKNLSSNYLNIFNVIIYNYL